MMIEKGLATLPARALRHERRCSMKITFDWEDEDQTIVRVTLADDWRWEELYTINAEIARMIHDSQHPVYILIDYTNTNTVPLGGVITHTRNILSAYPETWVLTIFVTQNMLVQRLMTIFQTTFRAGLGKKVRLASSLGEAHRIITRHRGYVSIPT